MRCRCKYPTPDLTDACKTCGERCRRPTPCVPCAPLPDLTAGFIAFQWAPFLVIDAELLLLEHDERARADHEGDEP